MALTIDVSDTHRIVLQEVWRYLETAGRWPTFAEIDRLVYQSHDMDLAHVLQQIPSDLVSGLSVGPGVVISKDQHIGLSVAGAWATGRAERELGLFIRTVMLAAEVERDHQSDDGADSQPELHADWVALKLNLRADDSYGLLTRLGVLLLAEPWGWASAWGVPGHDWNFRMDRRVRAFRGVTDLGSYWQQRQAILGARRTELEANRKPTGGTEGWSAKDVLPAAVAVVSILATLPYANSAYRGTALVAFAIAAVFAWHYHQRPLLSSRRLLSLTVCAVAACIFAGSFVFDPIEGAGEVTTDQGENGADPVASPTSQPPEVLTTLTGLDNQCNRVVFAADNATEAAPFIDRAEFPLDTITFMWDELSAGGYAVGELDVRLHVQTSLSQQVTIYNVRLVDVEKGPTVDGSLIHLETCGGDQVDRMVILIDRADQRPLAVDEYGNRTDLHFFDREVINVSPGDKQSILIQIVAPWDMRGGSYAFRIALDFEVDGQTYTRYLDNDGEPFRITAPACGYKEIVTCDCTIGGYDLRREDPEDWLPWTDCASGA